MSTGNKTPIRDLVRELAPDLSHVNMDVIGRNWRNPEAFKQVAGTAIYAPRSYLINRRMAQYTARTGDFFFVEIGANNGKDGDRVKNRVDNDNWQGVLVEPVPHIFDELVANYAGRSGLQFANVAVGPENGRFPMKMAKPMPDGSESPVAALSSFHEDVAEHFRAKIEGIDDLFLYQDVETVNFETLLEQYPLPRLDGVFVDTEGHDKAVLDGLDLERHMPKFVQWEHCNLSPDDQAAVVDKFFNFGYNILPMRVDTFAERPY